MSRVPHKSRQDTVLFNIFINSMEDGVACTLSKFTAHMKLGGEWLIHQRALLPPRGTMTGLNITNRSRELIFLLYSELTRLHLEDCAQFWACSVQETPEHTGKSPTHAHQDNTRLEHLFGEERMRAAIVQPSEEGVQKILAINYTWSIIPAAKKMDPGSF